MKVSMANISLANETKQHYGEIKYGVFLIYVLQKVCVFFFFIILMSVFAVHIRDSWLSLLTTSSPVFL